MRRLRRTFLSIVGGRFPLSLSFLLPSSHGAQQNQIVLLNQLSRAAACAEHLGARTLPPIVNVGHHDSHAAMFFASPFEEALVLVMDGYGDDSSSSAYLGRGNTPAAALVDQRHELGSGSSTPSSPSTWALPASATKAR